MEQFRAVLHFRKWHAQVWSNLDQCYYTIKACPSFDNPRHAIAWAVRNW